MKYAALRCAVILALLLSGCGGTPAVSVRPLYDTDVKPATDARMEGEWISPNLDEVGKEQEIAQRWKFTRDDEHYMVELREPGTADKKDSPDKVDRYRVSLVPLGDKTFIDAELIERTTEKGTIGQDDIKQGMIAVHLLGRIWIAPDYLRVSLVDSSWVKANTPEDYRAMYGGTAVMVSPAAEVRKFFTQHADEKGMFMQPLFFCRPGTDCPMHVADDLLVREPNDPDVLQKVARILMARHQYKKATALLRHRVELQPEESDAHAELALSLANERDFKGAETELEAVSRLTTDAGDKTSVQQMICAAHFLDGSYEQAATICSADSRSAIAILFNYYSLLRLGRRKQAVAFLTKASAQFSGSAQDQILLLDAQGRIEDINNAIKSSEDKAIFFYFEGLSAIAKGDSKTAHERLKTSLEAGDDLTSLPAKVELERMEKVK